MASFENTQSITRTQLQHEVSCYCPLGGSTCTYAVAVEYVPNSTLLDFMDIQREINILEGQELSIEDAIDRIGNIVVELFAGDFKSIKVTIDCWDANHFPVRVEKEVLPCQTAIV